MITSRLTPATGHTLVEVLIYFSLYSIFMGGGLIAADSVMEASGRAQTQAMVQTEGDFLQAKIQRLLDETEVIISPPLPVSPATETTSDVLSLSTSSGETVTVRSTGHRATIERSRGPLDVSNDNIEVERLRFSRQEPAGLMSLAMTFTLRARTPLGARITLDFSRTYYIQK